MNIGYDTIFADVDECRAGMSLCEHGCTNRVGSYTCSCSAGYTLANNGISCLGKFKYVYASRIVHMIDVCP